MTEAGEKKRAGKGHTMKHQTAVTESSATGRVRIKRAYEPATDGDGYRVLVDRLWPRGVSKDKAHLDTWMKDIAPSTELRRWFGHDPARWDEFERRYRAELAEPERSRSGAGSSMRWRSGPHRGRSRLSMAPATPSTTRPSSCARS